MTTQANIEIMSPAGSYESLMAAIQGGAHSVYFGVGTLNMRARSTMNFSFDDLAQITAICREHKVRSYLTVNTVIYDDEMEYMQQLVDAAIENGISAIIASDLSVMEYARNRGMEIHISTQCNITNMQAVRFYARYADVMVLARELSLEQVAAIAKNIEKENITGHSGKKIVIEMFVHGAMCMAVSGKCYLSQDMFNKSANRGACYQPCRREYRIRDYDNEVDLNIDNHFILSPKDMKTIGFLDKILEAGVGVLKIEGRGRSPEYVKTVTQCYREAADAVGEGTFNAEKIQKWNDHLNQVYNRGYWDGYYLGKTLPEWTNVYGSKAIQRKVYVGKITNYFAKAGVAEIKIETGELRIGDAIIISGPTTGVLEGVIEEIRVNEKPVELTVKGEICSIPVKEIVRRSDKLYKIIAR
ncbi:MAG: peptidase U32 family protein [Bacteroidales bacterium]|nr:peptidase U32 family protein [Bacteroidales bacterium]MDZ4203303.1 peptidase U32 family protein [Bacteroidales bacterium]